MRKKNIFQTKGMLCVALLLAVLSAVSAQNAVKAESMQTAGNHPPSVLAADLQTTNGKLNSENGVKQASGISPLFPSATLTLDVHHAVSHLQSILPRHNNTQSSSGDNNSANISAGKTPGAISRAIGTFYTSTAKKSTVLLL